MPQKHAKIGQKTAKIALFCAVLSCFSAGFPNGFAAAQVPKNIPAPPAFARNSEDWSRLNSGQVVVNDFTSENADHIPTVEAKILIPRSADVVRKVVSDPVRLMKDEPKVRDLRLLSKSGNTEMMSYTVFLGHLLPTFNYVLRNQQITPDLVQFTRISGSFKDFSGSWRVTPVDADSTLLTYHLRLDPGPGLPTFLISTLVKADLPHMMENAKAAILSE